MMKGEKPNKISVSHGSNIELIEIEKIVRLQAEGSCTWFFLESTKKILASKNLGYYEKLLNGKSIFSSISFIRTHHKHSVNLKFFEKINRHEKFAILNNGDNIPISQRRYSDVLSYLT